MRGFLVIAHVRGHFSKAEKEQMQEGYDRVDESIRLILQDELARAMNQFNKKVIRED